MMAVVRVLFLLALVWCPACGDTPPNYIYLEPAAEPELAPYVDQFVAEMKARGVYPVPGVHHPRLVAWMTLDPGIVGMCVTPTPRVYIQLRIRGYSDMYIRAVVYHELGHCMYGLLHDVDGGHILSEYLAYEDVSAWDEQQLGLELDYLAERIRSESTAFLRWLVLKQQ